MFMYTCIFWMAVTSLSYSDGGTTKKTTDAHSPILYPGPIQEVVNRYGVEDDEPEVPEQCKNKNFCTIKPKNYPQELVNQMFKGHKYAEPPSLILDEMVDNRQGDDSTDDCEINVTYEPLYHVKSEAGDWRTVLQAPEENYVQRVRLEECIDPGKTCFNVFLGDPGVEVFCKQKYNVWEVLVAPKNGRTKPEKIKATFPVCCSCAYKMSEPENRFGGKRNNTNITSTKTKKT